MKNLITYLIAYGLISCVECTLFAQPVTILYRTLPPEDLAEFAPAFIALALGLGVAAGLLGWGIYKIITKILSIIDARNAKPVEMKKPTAKRTTKATSLDALLAKRFGANGSRLNRLLMLELCHIELLKIYYAKRMNGV